MASPEALHIQTAMILSPVFVYLILGISFCSVLSGVPGLSTYIRTASAMQLSSLRSGLARHPGNSNAGHVHPQGGFVARRVSLYHRHFGVQQPSASRAVAEEVTEEGDDYYGVLGVPPTASTTEIKRAYYSVRRPLIY